MRLSKHHYATTLAHNGSKVYFLEPAIKGLKHVQQEVIKPGLTVIRYPMIARGWGKLPGFIFELLSKIEMKQLIKQIGYPDVVWCFDPLRLVQMTTFKKSLKIYHPVDQFDKMLLRKYKIKPDICFSTMNSEVDMLRKNGLNAFLIWHGLSNEFKNLALKRLEQLKSGSFNIDAGAQIDVGFCGNLGGDAIDRSVMRKVIVTNPDCLFHFWGKFDVKDDAEKMEFVAFLQQQPNVKLYGAVQPEELATYLQEMKMFWVIWRNDGHPQWNQFTNPHKIVEYLSTGVPVVTHYMDMYASNQLLEMLPKDSDSTVFVGLFKSVKEGIKAENGTDKMIKRISFALANSYESHISSIEEHINQLK